MGLTPLLHSIQLALCASVRPGRQKLMKRLHSLVRCRDIGELLFGFAAHRPLAVNYFLQLALRVRPVFFFDVLDSGVIKFLGVAALSDFLEILFGTAVEDIKKENWTDAE